MGCSLSTKICLLCIFTILFFGVILYKRMDFLGVLGFYVAMTPCICCWIASKDEKSDEPHFPYNRPLRSIYPDPSFKEKMAERALELENFLEGSPKTSIEDPPIPKGSIANSLSQKKFKLKDGCELSLELTLNVETTVTQIQKHEEKCSNENEGKGTVRKESDVGEEGFEESSKREDEEHQKFSLYKTEDVELQKYSLDKREDGQHQELSLNKGDVELQEYSLDKREDEQHQEFSLDKKDDVELQEFSLDKVPLEFLYKLGH